MIERKEKLQQQRKARLEMIEEADRRFKDVLKQKPLYLVREEQDAATLRQRELELSDLIAKHKLDHISA